MANPLEKTPQQKSSKGQLKYLRYEEGEDSASEVRNVRLIVATLIAAVTFQAGVSPPGGVWQDGIRAGKAIYAGQKAAFYVFLIFNTLALSSSVLIIIILTFPFPLRFEIFVAMVSMVVTYGSAIFAVTPGESSSFRYVLITASGPFIIRGLIEMFRKFSERKNADSDVQEISNNVCP